MPLLSVEIGGEGGVAVVVEHAGDLEGEGAGDGQRGLSPRYI